MRLRKFLVLLGIVLLSGCAIGSHKPAPAPFASLSRDEQEMYEAVLEYLFARWTGQETDTPDKYYLEINGADAPADLLAKYRQKGRDVHPASQYRHGHGVKCSAGAIVRLSDSRAQTHGGYLFGDVGQAWGNFELINEWGIWRVAKWKPKVE